MDPRSTENEEPFKTIRSFGLVIKGSYLADCYHKNSIPRCELQELVENANMAAKKLEKAKLYEYESWADKVNKAGSFSK